MADGPVRDDAALVKQSCEGCTSAFGALVQRYERGARVVAMRYSTDHASADDAVQQAFVKAFERLKTLRDGSRFGAWLLRIVEREACSLASKQSRFLELHQDVPTIESQTSDELDSDIRLVAELVGRLPEHEQVVVHLHYLNSMPTRQIAQVTGRPIGTVTKQLSRAVGRLREWLEHEEVVR